ncbi:glycosyltransferase [Synechococcus sp. A15-60]|uniref:glycosyltransferase n=1 Tax=Synechococcus sp. A15-60 TaxID=1050655 RepID=UPI0016476DD4|nr:glycosyltransferase [Synechococcus sp. A15-60]QNI46823.1 glycosyl transferase/ family 4 [Synechococcus sp. A15-60]
MKLLLLHQNFPGQFRQLTPCLIERGHQLLAICSHQRPLPEIEGLRVLRYDQPPPMSGEWPYGTQLWHEALRRAESVGGFLQQLASEGWRPDRVLAHCGWGEALPVKEQWPEVPLLVWPELWLRPEHMGFGSDPLKGPVTSASLLANVGRNALAEASLAQATAWIVPTRHQANSFPAAYQNDRMHVVHEGIDTQLACPNPEVSYEVRGVRVNRSVPTITFVNRNLERLRGFDTFMRALPIIQRQHPTVRVVIVGDNEGGYGGADPSGLPLREVMLKELQGQLDLERIHFLGRIPHPYLISMLQASWVHIYLSYPFILGWSLLEAMGCGCCIVGSRGMPVEEVIHDGVQGVLVPMDDHERLAQRVLALIANPQLRDQLGRAARQASLAWDQSVTLPKLTALIEGLTG